MTSYRDLQRIRFDSAYGYAESQQERLGDRRNAYPEPFNFIRETPAGVRPTACAAGDALAGRRIRAAAVRMSSVR